jgi:hypothetical protein
MGYVLVFIGFIVFVSGLLLWLGMHGIVVPGPRRRRRSSFGKNFNIVARALQKPSPTRYRSWR